MKKIALLEQQFNKEIAQNTKSDRTKEVYLEIARKLLDGTLTAANIRTRSRFYQVRAALRKMRLVGVVGKDETCGLNMDLLADEFKKREDRNTAIKRVKDKCLTDAQFQAVLSALPNTSAGKEARLACAISRTCGARLFEVLALTPGDFQATDAGYIVQIAAGKGRKPRYVFLPKMNLESFQGFTIDRMYLNLAVHRAMKKAAVHSSFHGLRHSFASEAVQGGVSIVDMAAMLGHSDVKTTMIYMHVQPECPQALLDLWEKKGYTTPKER